MPLKSTHRKSEWGIRSRARPSKEAQRARQLRKLQIIVGAALASVCVLSGAILWGIRHDAIAIQEIQLSGVAQADEAAVRSLLEAYVEKEGSGLVPHTNKFLFSRKEVRDMVKGSSPYIHSASVAVVGFTEPTLEVKVQERMPFARWCDTECYVMDKVGYIFAKDAFTEVPIRTRFAGGIAPGNPVGAAYGSNFFPHLVALVELLESRGFSVANITIENDTDITLQFVAGYDLYAHIRMQPEALLGTLELSLAAEPLRGKKELLQYIDIRFGNRVYYKFRGASAEEVQ